MTDNRLLADTEITPPVGRRPGLVESMLQKWFMRRSRVESIEALHPKFRLITLSGEALKNVAWTPGDKVQIQLGGWVMRTYTPLEWDANEGRTRILVYLHAEGPGTEWARTLRVGDSCALFGPRKSVDLTQLRRPAILFGDETSFGLARSLGGTDGQAEGVAFLFELSTPQESLAALEHLRISNVSACVRTRDDSHWLEVQSQMRRLLAAHRPVEFVLTGKSTSVQRLRNFLKLEGVSASRIRSRAYWAPGRKGLD